jgi:N-acetylglucosaminyldiphosphoundecaprenol N-acetyl-beta-D-mannosaminyltransferase
VRPGAVRQGNRKGEQETLRRNLEHTNPGPHSSIPTRRIVGTRVDATSYGDATGRILDWARAGESRYVCVATVNNVMEARHRPMFKRVMNEADLVTPDGMPLVWGLRLLGISEATRVYGPDLTPVVCAAAADAGIPVGFFGGTAAVLDALSANMRQRFPKLQIAYRWSPPFRPLSPEEEDRVTGDVAASGARILFVGLGTPKQELWMAGHRGRLPAVMVGVGAAFDFLAGAKKQAPRWMQGLGLEWLFRFTQEPRRLWRRYLFGNPRFVVLFIAQVITGAAARITGRPAADGKPPRNEES